MVGWVSATGRILGILVCSALLLTSVTLVQAGQASPGRTTPPIAVEAASNEPVATDQPENLTTTEQTVADTSSATVPHLESTPAPASPDTLPDTLTSEKLLPKSGSGIVPPPDQGIQFNKATPVRMAPVRLQIPEAGVDAGIQTVGVTPEGEMEAPDDFWEVGWYRYGTRPGDPGRAVIAGHLDSYSGTAVFYSLGDLQPGDDIRILLGGPDGERFFTVREVAHYPTDEAPVEHIFGPSDRPELVLITCGGDWQGSHAGYSDRIVVYADMVPPDVPRT